MGQSGPHKRKNLGPTPTPLPYVKHKLYAKLQKSDLLGGSVVKNPPTNAGGVGSVPGLERSLREGNGNPLQYSCLGNPMDREVKWITVHGVTKSVRHD